MKFIHRAVIGACAAAVVVGPSATAVASQSIGWTWNSDDHDSKATFVADGDNFYAYEYNGTNYVSYKYSTNSTQRWYIPGSGDKTMKTLNLSMAENKTVTMKVCQTKENWPEDCSSTKYGVS